ncbi:hypothetical protein Pan241w_32190 [Gimesia alba]|uniref:Uncharacterized protein n=1 Tax=Gimesia alba TaxID=2527973 RepID=A0A517RGW6_9PLAN|nr:hypothetical protein Pan241w_32190 [Gimesia alba]
MIIQAFFCTTNGLLTTEHIDRLRLLVFIDALYIFPKCSTNIEPYSASFVKTFSLELISDRIT